VRRVTTASGLPSGSGTAPFQAERAAASAVCGTSPIARDPSARTIRIFTGGPGGSDRRSAARSAASSARGEGTPATSIPR
jgi:hypothetical protein